MSNFKNDPKMLCFPGYCSQIGNKGAQKAICRPSLADKPGWASQNYRAIRPSRWINQVGQRDYSCATEREISCAGQISVGHERCKSRWGNEVGQEYLRWIKSDANRAKKPNRTRHPRFRRVTVAERDIIRQTKWTMRCSNNDCCTVKPVTVRRSRLLTRIVASQKTAETLFC